MFFAASNFSPSLSLHVRGQMSAFHTCHGRTPTPIEWTGPSRLLFSPSFLELNQLLESLSEPYVSLITQYHVFEFAKSLYSQSNTSLEELEEGVLTSWSPIQAGKFSISEWQCDAEWVSLRRSDLTTVYEDRKQTRIGAIYRTPKPNS